jgi:hypothetical protein
VLAPASAALPKSAGVRLTGYVTAALLAETTNVINARQGSATPFCRARPTHSGNWSAPVFSPPRRTALERAWATWNPPGSASKDLGPGGVIDTSLTAGAANPRRIAGRQEAL